MPSSQSWYRFMVQMNKRFGLPMEQNQLHKFERVFTQVFAAAIENSDLIRHGFAYADKKPEIRTWATGAFNGQNDTLFDYPSVMVAHTTLEIDYIDIGRLLQVASSRLDKVIEASTIGRVFLSLQPKSRIQVLVGVLQNHLNSRALIYAPDLKDIFAPDVLDYVEYPAGAAYVKSQISVSSAKFKVLSVKQEPTKISFPIQITVAIEMEASGEVEPEPEEWHRYGKLQSKVLHVAEQLPKGSTERRKLLSFLKKASVVPATFPTQANVMVALRHAYNMMPSGVSLSGGRRALDSFVSNVEQSGLSVDFNKKIPGLSPNAAAYVYNLSYERPDGKVLSHVMSVGVKPDTKLNIEIKFPGQNWNLGLNDMRN